MKYIDAVRCALALAVLAAAGCGGKDGAGAADAAPAAGALSTTALVLSPTDVVTAARDSLRAGVVVSGTLQPYRVVDVRAQVPGVLTGLRVDRGTAVGAGEVVAVIQAAGIQGQAAGARAAVASARAALALAARQLESARKLHDAGAMSDIEFQQAKAADEAAEAQLAAAQAQSAGAQEAASRAKVTAPLAGRVSARAVSDGEAVSPGQLLLTLVNSGILELAGQVPADDAVRIRPGMPVEFTVDAYPGRTLRGSVARVEPTADPDTRQVGVYVRLPNPAGALVGGLFATGRILTGTASESVVLPAAAVRGEGAGAYVWRISGGRAERRAVNLGARDEARGVVQVLSGISAGDRVVAAPGDLTEGQQVRINAAAPAAAGPDVRGS